MENRFRPFAPVDFRRKPEPFPLLKYSLTLDSKLVPITNGLDV